MFQPEPPDVPNIFDGSFINDPADFNATELLQEAVETWNFFMNTCKKYILGSSQTH